MSMPNTHSRIEEVMDDHEDIPWREMIDAMAMSNHANELPLLMEEKYIRECIITLNKANVSPAESISGCPPQELQEADDELDEGEEEFHPSKLKTEEQKEMKKDECSQTATGAETGRKRRRRAMKKKNTEEVEYQRMVHITVERNRRRQMNDHLAVLRSLMPPSYIQRGDQASIVGGAIEFVKELEHTLQSLIQRRKSVCGADSSNPKLEEQSTHPFQTLVPQQRSQDSGCTSSSSSSSMDSSSSKSKSKSRSEGGEEGQQREVAFCGSCHAQVEVERVGPLFQVKVLSSSHAHGYLLRLITALQHSLGFIIRHLHVTTSGHAIIYSVDVEPTAQVGEHLISVHELAFSVHHIFGSQDLMDSVFS